MPTDELEHNLLQRDQKGEKEEKLDDLIHLQQKIKPAVESSVALVREVEEHKCLRTRSVYAASLVTSFAVL